jgi:signal transduction histidine kinase
MLIKLEGSQYIYWKNHLYNYLLEKIKNFGIQPMTFGIFGIINYPLSYLNHQIYYPEINESVVFRIKITLMCGLLLVNNKISRKFENFKYIYWFFCITISLPCFGVYMILYNHASSGWMMNYVLGLFLLILISDWIIFIISTILGIILGTSIFVIFNGFDFYTNGKLQEITPFIYFYLFTFIIGIIFSRNKEVEQDRRLLNYGTVVKTMVHELRTPLSSMRLASTKIKEILDNKQNNWELLSQQNNYIQTISSDSLLFLEFMLTKIGINNENIPLSFVKIKDTVDFALSQYPFTGKTEKMMIKNNIQDDNFYIKINQTFLTHIIYNLVSNGIYEIKKNITGSLIIFCSENKSHYLISFRNTETSISKEVLKKLFNKFYTTKTYGTGLGLYFCRNAMESMGGRISCKSVEGEYTEFVLKFPKVEEAI